VSVDPERVAVWRRLLVQLDEELADAALEALREEIERAVADELTGDEAGGPRARRAGRTRRPQLEQLLSRSRHALARAEALLGEAEALARGGAPGRR
jgi:hypothetical protein